MPFVEATGLMHTLDRIRAQVGDILSLMNIQRMCGRIVVGIAVFVVFAIPAHAATVEEMQSRITALQAELNRLMSELQAMNRGPAAGTPSLVGFQFVRTLYRDLSDAETNGEVTKLQQFLTENPVIYPEGRVTGHFGPLTERALQRWQAARGLVSSGAPGVTGFGVFGPRTRTAVNAVLWARRTPAPSPSPSPSVSPQPSGSPRPSGSPSAALGALSIWASGPITLIQPRTGSNSATNTLSASTTAPHPRSFAFRQTGFPTGARSTGASSCSFPCTAQNTVSIAPTTPVGSHPITVTATIGSLTATTSYMLNVTAHQPMSFALTASGDITISRPTSGTFPVSNRLQATLISGTPESVSFSQSGLPAGVSAARFAPCAPTCEVVNTLTLSTRAATGTYPISVSGTAGGLVGTTNYTLTITDPVPYIVRLSTSRDITIRRPGTGIASGDNAVTATYEQGNQVPVTFAQTGFPAGTGATLPGGCTPTCTVTNVVSVSATTPLGTYPITLTAAGGGATASTTYRLIVE